MCANRHHADHIFQHEFGKGQGRQRAVYCGDDNRAAGGEQGSNRRGKQAAVCYMLNHLRGIDDIKLCATFCKRLCGAAMIVDRQSAQGRMGAGGLNRRSAGINAGDIAAQPCHRFGQQSTATAYIKHAQSGKRRAGSTGAGTCTNPPDAVQNVIDAHRREVMQRCHRAGFVPPFGRHGREIANFFFVCRRIHRLAPFPGYRYDTSVLFTLATIGQKWL